MAAYYCKSCGAKTVSDRTPNFCSKCATPFFASSNAGSVAPTKPKKILPFKKQDMEDNFPDDDDNYTDVTSVPSLDNIGYQIDHSAREEGVTVGQILEANKGKTKKRGKTSKKVEPPREKAKSKEAILEEFKKSAQSSGPISID